MTIIASGQKNYITYTIEVTFVGRVHQLTNFFSPKPPYSSPSPLLFKDSLNYRDSV